VSTDQSEVRRVITALLDRVQKGQDGFADDTPLYGDGLGLDSLEAAELSALLEDELGSDPFSAGGELPQTVGDVLAFYEAAPAP
jgi:acyl carrier protein